jgi:hypothetical protein
MKSRTAKALAVCAVVAAIVYAFPPIVERLLPQTGLTRSVFSEVGFRGVPTDARTFNIDLRFVDEQAALPRQNFSARWRGYFYISQAQTIEFFAGGNDEVELRIDGALLLRRSLREGMRTIGRRVPLDAGSHEIAVDYQQFGGGMALNIQRALAGQMPAPFLPTELFSQPVDSRHVQMLAVARRVRSARPIVLIAAIILLVGGIAALNVQTLLRYTGAPRNFREYGDRLWLIAAPALLAPAIALLLGPYTIFASNPGEFAVPFRQLAAPWLLKSVAINWLALFSIGCALALVSRTAVHVYSALLFAFGLLLWGQGHLWNADYGVLAGREVDLAQHAARSRYETAAFVAVLVAATMLFRRISRIAPFASVVFLVVQGVAAAARSSQPSAEGTRWIEPPAEIFTFSRAQNIIHIVLDEFQSDVFTEILHQDRLAFDSTFSGFTYFEDHLAASPTTSMSMPAMLTGLAYRNDVPAPEFVQDAFKRSSIFEKVSREGYDVDAMSIVPIPSFEDWLGPEATPNWKGSRFRIRKPFISQGDYREVSSRLLLELSLFRHVPHAAKAFSVERPDAFYRVIWMDRGESPSQIRRHEASNSVAFFEQFVSSMTVGRDRPVYKLLHVGVPHRPVVVDGDCRFIGGTAMSRQSYMAQSRCAVKLVGQLLDRVRSLGIYESSLIIVSSDHGTDLHPLGFKGVSDSLSLVPGPSTSRLPAIVGSAKAIMFIKPPHRTGPVSVSSAPTTHVDLPSTILDILNLPGATTTESMMRRPADQPRTRIYGMYDPRQRFPKGYLDRLDLLSVDGPMLDAASWRVQRSIWTPSARLEGRDVDVGIRDSHRYLGPGWSFGQSEPAGNGGDVSFAQPATAKAVLYASLPRDAVELVLRASSSPGPAPDSLRVYVDGKEISKLKMRPEGYRDLSVRLPADSRRPSISEITLHFDSGARNSFVFKLDRFLVK